MPSTSLAIAIAFTATASASLAGCNATSSKDPDLPQAAVVRAIPTVAALFAAGLDQDHSCTASVVSSTTRDLLVTAAHCISGDGSKIRIAPGYDLGNTPYGVWSVTSVFVDPAWQSTEAAADDVAILRVSPAVVNGASRTLQDVTGGNTLAATASPPTAVTVQGFNAGRDDPAISCTTAIRLTRGGNPTFGCDGYMGGTSGSPWLVTGANGKTQVTGVIGGLNQGGCRDRTSFSPVFDGDVKRLLVRAERSGNDGDVLPTAGPAPACSED